MTKRLAVGLRSARQLPFGLSRSQCVVDAALELAVERDGLVVGEGQDLGQKHPGDSLLRVEPVIGIIYTGPSYAADAAPVRKALDAPLDIVLVRKIGVPWQPELAVGAVIDGTSPEIFIDADLANALRIPESYVK